jgi:hypothetical protein
MFNGLRWLVLAVAAYAAFAYLLLSCDKPPLVPPDSNQASERPPLNQNGYTRIPLVRTNAGYLNVTAKIAGNEVNLLLDTGSPSSCLDRKRVESLKLKWEQRPGISVTVRKTEWGEYRTIESIQLGAFHTGGLPIYSLDMSDLNGWLANSQDRLVDGILGADVLERAWAVIDYRMNDLFLFDRNSLD